jgi:hypothetical protein
MRKLNPNGFSSTGLLSVQMVFLLLFLFPGNSSSQSRFDVPTANTAIGNPVPFPRIEKIAIQKCKEKWGKGALGEPIPLCDLEGNLTAYMFPFHIGADRFPSYEEIFTRIKDGRELHEHIKNQQIDKAREKYQGLKQSSKEAPKSLSAEIIHALSDPQVVTIEGVRPDGSRPRSFEVAEIREMEKFALKKAAGGDNFGTIVVSATYGRVPVPVYYHRLPSYYTRQDLAREKAEKVIGPDVSLQRILFLGMRGKIFEFANQRGKALLHASTLENKEEEIAEMRGKGRQTQQLSSTEMEGRRAKVREKLARDWETIHAEVGEK